MFSSEGTPDNNINNNAYLIVAAIVVVLCIVMVVVVVVLTKCKKGQKGEESTNVRQQGGENGCKEVISLMEKGG